MKAQRRHELKESDLAKELGKAGQFIKTNLRSLTMSLAIVIAVIFLIVMLVSRRAETRQAEWRDLYTLTVVPQADPAQTRAELRALAEETSQDALAAWAYVRIGELATSEMASRQYELSGAQMTLLNTEAQAAFGTVLSRYDDHVRAVAKAHLGLGRLAESTGNLEGARQAYQAAAELEPKGARLVAAVALRRQAQLDSLPAEVLMPNRPEPADAPAEEPADVPAE